MAVLKSTLKLSLLDDVTAKARRISGVLNGLQRQNAALMSPLRGIGGQLLAFGGAYLGVTQGIDATAGAAMRFESAFADVKKVVSASDEQFENMRRTIKQMSTEIPLTAVDIASIFAAAGESGVATNDLKSFAEMAARVGIAFDMSAGEAGESLAKLKTQLGLTVGETGDMADAINHLSNNMASKASDITNYMLRVGSLAEMGGFAKEEIAAIGSAMIAAGAESETAGTAMQNVVKAMTRGSFAKKGQQEAAAALGLDLPTIAKQMQKDAPKALKKVLGAIAKAPKSQQIAILSQFFGDEAKAFAPLIGNIGLLDQALDSVSDKAKYGGSAFKEFVARSNTTANALQLLRNRFANVFEGIGESMLPSIKNAALGIGDILDTLGERATVFDQMSTAMQGFTQGLGFTGGIREAIAAMGDLLLGPADGSGAADKLGRIFAKFKEWGADVREFNAALQDSAIGRFLGEVGGYGFKLMLASVAFGILAGSVRKLASALLFLSGASTAIGIIKTLGKVGTILTAGTPGGKPGKPGPAAPKAAPGFLGKVLPVIGRLTAGFAGIAATAAIVQAGKEKIASDPARQAKADEHTAQNMRFLKSLIVAPKNTSHPYAGTTVQGADGVSARPDQVSPFLAPPPDDGSVSARPIAIDQASISAMMQPTGVQQVAVTNQQPVAVNVNNSFVINEAANAQATAAAVAAQSGAAAKAAVESSFAGGGRF